MNTLLRKTLYCARLSNNKFTCYVAAISNIPMRNKFGTSVKTPIIEPNHDTNPHDKATEAMKQKPIPLPLKADPTKVPVESIDETDDDLVEEENMFVQGPAGLEWGGPTRGGRRPEPTRYGDWERKGRVSDF